jgi:hypothetical protein
MLNSPQFTPVHPASPKGGVMNIILLSKYFYDTKRFISKIRRVYKTGDFGKKIILSNDEKSGIMV